MSGVKDIDLLILSKLDDKSLFIFSQTNKYGKKLYENENFWRNRFYHKYNKIDKNPERTWKNFYLNIIYYTKNYFPYEIINKLSKGGMKNIDLINFFFSKEDNSYYIWNEGMITATIEGDKDLIYFYVSKGANDWNKGMLYAARGGYKDLVDFFILKGAKRWNTGLENAARGGHKDLVDFFILKGAGDLNFAMFEAAKGGHRDLVDLFISKGANDWCLGIIGSSKHPDLLEFFKEKL